MIVVIRFNMRPRLDAYHGDSTQGEYQVLELGCDYKTILEETGWFIAGVRILAATRPDQRKKLLNVCQDSILLLLFRANFSDLTQALYFSAFFKAACRIEQFLDEEAHLFVTGDDASSDGVIV